MGFHLLSMRLWLIKVLSMLQSPEEGDFRHSHYNDMANFGAIVMLTSPTCSSMDQDRTLCSGRMCGCRVTIRNQTAEADSVYLYRKLRNQPRFSEI